MSYEVVARRWRPSTFADVIGQDHVTQTLANALERDRVAHAFVFAGVRGVGKTTVARLLARALNCPNRKGAEPCNECSQCLDAIAGASVDILEIDGASHTGVDHVRGLIENAQYRPAQGPYRIYIIDEVHRLSGPAFDALLKLLEEPPAHVKFILATTEAHKLPATIQSRCQRYDFRRLTREEIARQLAAIVKKDKLGVAKDALDLLAREADGSMRDAQSLLEQVVAACGDKVEQEDVSRILGIAGTALVADGARAVLGCDAAAVVGICERVRSGGFSAERYLAALLELLRHTAVALAAGVEVVAKTQGETVAGLVAELKDTRSQLDLQRIFDVLLATGDKMRPSGLPDLVLEMGLLKAASLDNVASAAEILAWLRGGGGAGSSVSGAASGARGGGSAQAGPSRARRAAEADSAGASMGRSPSAARTVPRDEPQAGEEGSATQARGPLASDQPPTAFDDVPPPDDMPGDEALSEDGSEWESFLTDVRTECGFELYAALSNCEVTRLDGSVLELRPALGKFRERLQSNDAVAHIRTIASNHFGREVDIRLLDPTTKMAEASDEPNQSISVRKLEDGRRQRLEQSAVEDPSVKAALTVLGGRIERITQVDD